MLRSEIGLDLLLVFLTALGIRLLWAALIPPWVAPDEGSHFTYVSHLVEQGEIPHEPPYAESAPEFSEEVRASWDLTLFGRISCAGASRDVELEYYPLRHDYRAARKYKAPDALRKSAAGGTATTYPPAYYAIGAIAYKAFHGAPVLTRLYAVRVMSALLGALACCFAYLLAFELRGSPLWGRAIGGAMAVMPMNAFVSASVNNDAGMLLGSTALCYMVARLAKSTSVSAAFAALLGLTVAFTLMTKQTGAAVALVACAALLFRSFPLRLTPMRLERERLVSLVTFALTLTLTYGAWMAYRLTAVKFAASGVPSHEADVAQTLLGTPKHGFVDYLRQLGAGGAQGLYDLVIRMYWGFFGWLEAPLPEWTFSGIVAMYVLAALGIVILIWTRPEDRSGILLMLGLVIIHAGFLLGVADYLLSYAKFGTRLGLQGRYLFPTLAPLLYLLCSGLHAIGRERSFMLKAFPAAVFFIQLVAVSVMLESWYGIVLPS